MTTGNRQTSCPGSTSRQLMSPTRTRGTWSSRWRVYPTPWRSRRQRGFDATPQRSVARAANWHPLLTTASQSSFHPRLSRSPAHTQFRWVSSLNKRCTFPLVVEFFYRNRLWTLALCPLTHQKDWLSVLFVSSPPGSVGLVCYFRRASLGSVEPLVGAERLERSQQGLS